MKIKIILISTIFLLLPQSILAADYFFNPNLIISDDDFLDYNCLTLNEIQQFLLSKNSPLADMSFLDYQGINKKASEIIWQAAQESKISPKVILTTLQKEQSLIEDPIPIQNQFDKAMGYRCFDNAICNPKALGFGKQVDGATWQFRQYFDNPNNWTYKINSSYNVDGFSIIIQNQATANLYNYTPHYSGNQSFFKIWQRFWGKNYPDGSLVKAQGSAAVWLIQYNQRRPIASYSVLLSRFNPKKILPITQSDLNKYEVGPVIKFYNYSLLRLPTGEVYLLVDDELRPITSPQVFSTIGFNWEEVEDASPKDLIGYSYGQEITVKSAYPTGALLQNKSTGGVFYVENGIKHPIYSKEILKTNFKDKVLTKVSPAELDKFETGDPVKFRDGELVKAKGDPRVYVISNGYRRTFKDEKSFAKFGYQWHNIIETTPSAINLIPLGEDIE
ncbi:MAG: hypothetical protein WCX71_00020 [Candidatus Buchananbacteria bacterium]